MFVDHVILEIKAGKGGDGVIAWRREKYIPKGGPCGGDGGKGGSVVFVADSQIPSLEAYRNRYEIKAQNGQGGGSNNRRGRGGETLFLKVPVGTLIRDAETGEVLRDLTEGEIRYEICRGGKGGKGNTNFKSPTNRAPVICTPGKKGESIKV
ncbi:MAG: GTPase ObgE, partial [Chlamydiia bacterium]|nr:GTPase ObgE [Chlamydiia bacterium]